MKVAFLASEAVPYAKTGGLADVVGSLPRYLGQLGVEVFLFLPFYQEVKKKNWPLRRAAEINLDWQGKPTIVPLWEYESPQLRVLFIQNDSYYFRDGLYGTASGDHPDNGERFAFYSLAALEAMRAVSFRPDIIHAHDWQAALSLAYLRYHYQKEPFFSKTRSLFTVHNLAYQGIFPAEIIGRIGLPRDVFRLEEMEFYGRVNFLKAGLVYSDAISTVSPTYSREIQEPENGCGLDGVLRQRASVVFGILNGIDTSSWNPEKDPLLPYHFSLEDMTGKKRCKEVLFRQFGFPSVDIDRPLVGLVTRLADQKGLDIVVSSLENLFSLGLRLVMLGQGDKKYQDLLAALQLEKRSHLGVKMAFDEALAHLIIAGSDLFLIPSRYEPCGLTQMYSLRYGTIPVVRAVGGLADTIQEFDPATLKGNGFRFKEYSAAALVEAVKKALSIYEQAPLWGSLIRNAMAADFSWERAAREYVELYQRLLRFDL